MIRPKDDLCDFCGTCVAVCPQDAIELFEARIAIIQDRCTECLNCVKVCPLHVLEERF
jgi:dissimilatory sulfite reductase (desulfoviridin) alpha/beta subunit